MPRQLPWLNKGGGRRTQVKQPPKPAAKPRIPSDIDDDFFDGTVLANSSKGKSKAVRDGSEYDDDLPDLPAEPSTPRTKSRNKDALRNKRAPSSSPPPIQDYIQPQIEPMRKGASRFDLRDDEWMMVEDEFLETAKLFTRHLHIAEYEKLKERIEAKKNEQVEAARPVVKDAGMSFESKMKEKAKVQEKRQRKAIRDVFASQKDDDDEREDDEALSRPGSGKAAASFNKTSLPVPTPLKPPPTAHDSDSDDLDATRPPQRLTARVTAAPAATPASSQASGPKSALRPQPNPAPASSSSSFAKPALPASTTKSRTAASRRNRATPFDMLDDYVPPTQPPSLPSQREVLTSRSPTNSVRSSSPVKSTIASTDRKPVGSVDFSDDWGSGKHASGGVSKETQERLAKRKAEREKETERKRKAAKLDDIPTFLF